jgi:sodium/bile acid cotransporter 7
VGQSGASIPLGPMVIKLALLVLLPMVLAQLVRMHSGVGEFATKKKGKLSLVAQSGVLLMVLIGSIQTGRHLDSGLIETPSLASLLVMIVLVIAVHLAAMWAGWLLGGVSRLTREDRIAVAFGSSQKTLLVGLTVALEVQASILPMVLFHVSQLIVDTVIADRMAGGVEAKD